MKIAIIGILGIGGTLAAIANGYYITAGVIIFAAYFLQEFLKAADRNRKP